MKELEYYRSQHIAAMSQGTDMSGQEPGSQQRGVSTKGTKDVAELDAQATAAEAMNQHYLSALRKYEAAKDDYDSLRNRYDDIISSHAAVVKQVIPILFAFLLHLVRFGEKVIQFLEFALLALWMKYVQEISFEISTLASSQKIF